MSHLRSQRYDLVQDGLDIQIRTYDAAYTVQQCDPRVSSLGSLSHSIIRPFECAANGWNLIGKMAHVNKLESGIVGVIMVIDFSYRRYKKLLVTIF